MGTFFSKSKRDKYIWIPDHSSRIEVGNLSPQEVMKIEIDAANLMVALEQASIEQRTNIENHFVTNINKYSCFILKRICEQLKKESDELSHAVEKNPTMMDAMQKIQRLEVVSISLGNIVAQIDGEAAADIIELKDNQNMRARRT